MHEPNDFMGPKNYVEILYVLHTTNMEWKYTCDGVLQDP